MTILKTDNEEQRNYDSMFITVGELCDTYNVNRSSIRYARENDLLPGAIAVGNQFVWRRAFIAPHIDKWLERTRGNK